MKKLLATIGVLTLLVGTGFGQSEPKHQDKKNGKHHVIMADIPNLTEEQKTQIKAIKEEGRKRMEPQREEMKVLRMKLMDMKSADNPNVAEINKLIDKSAKLKAEMEKNRTASQLKVRSILTPEQRKAVDAKRKEKQAMRDKKHEEHKQLREAR